MRSFNGNVIQKSKRRSANTEHIVYVHCHTVDSDRVVLVHHLSDDDLGTNAISRNGDSQSVSNVDHVSKVAQRQFNAVGPVHEGTLNPVSKVVHEPVLLFGINTSILISRVIAHRVTSTANSLS